LTKQLQETFAAKFKITPTVFATAAAAGASVVD
jgi:hypothetical protein